MPLHSQRPHRVRAVACVVVGLIALAPLSAQSPGPLPYRPDADPGLQGFHREVAAYIALRGTLATEIAPLTPNATAAEIASSSDALARAVQRARPEPPRGLFFDDAAVVLITQRLRQLLATPAHANLLEGIEDEPPTVQNPGVYLRFPAASMLATMPPSVLAILPALPAELEYRIIGPHLTLRDIHAALILDVIPNAVPRR